MSEEFISNFEDETRNLAKRFAETLHGGEILALYGDLGAGKTTFVKGLVEAFGIKEPVTSPTFVLMKVFVVPKFRNLSPRSRIPFAGKFEIRNLVHIDAYRLNDALELIDIGALDYLGKQGTITVLEWPECVQSLLGRFYDVIKISFEHGKTINERVITTQRR